MSETLHSILDTHPDVICRYDPDLNITYGNLAAATFFGVKKSDLKSARLLDLTAPDTHALITATLARITADTPSTTGIQRIHVNGTDRCILWANIGLYDDGTLREYQSVGRDVTSEVTLERTLKMRTEALADAQAELRSVLDAVPSRIWYKDDKNTILRLNQAAANSMGMSVEAVEGRNTYDLFGDAAKSYHEADLKVLSSGEALRGFIEPYTPDSGEQGWVQTDKIPISIDADDPRLLVVSTDITELKEQEAILKSINKNLDDFASLISHDLQAPLRKIGITSELMQMELADQLPDQTKPYFDDISDALTHMRTLIKSFLKFMRASPDSVELETVDLTALLHRIAALKIEILTDIGGEISLPEKPIHVRGDADLLGQVFTNLFENAIKYRSPDRSLRIKVKAKRKQQFWKISVRDNGSGVDKNFAGQIFDLFGRSKPHLGIEGSGIGLALCRRIITLHGGTIELNATHADGACFEVKLYRTRGAEHG